MLPALCWQLDSHVDLHAVIGSCVRMLGRKIERTPMRHYLGRVFATAASVVLSLPVYDTQCGAKVFRANEHLATIQERFRSRWAFDVEILSRLTGVTARNADSIASGIYEYPLPSWVHVGGSRLRPWDYLRVASDLLLIWRNERHEAD